MISFTHEALPGRVIFGAGASGERLVEETDHLGAGRILLVASGRDGDLVEKLSDLLGERLAATFDGVKQHVPVEVAEKARRAAWEAEADCLCSAWGAAPPSGPPRR